MRELRRSIARRLMELGEVRHINRKIVVETEGGGKVRTSYFARHWREYLDPESDYRRALEAGLRAAARRESEKTGKKVAPGWPVPRRRKR